MAIKIIVKGHIPNPQLYEVDCDYCESFLEFLWSDVKYQKGNANTPIIRCPLCRTVNEVHIVNNLVLPRGDDL